METREKVELESFEKKFTVIENVAVITHDLKTANRLCLQPYYRHKHGCPNFGHKEGCPPGLKHISEEYDMSSIHILFLEFPLAEYAEARRDVHPNWTSRALINPRHWQGYLRAKLRGEWKRISEEYPEHEYIINPEGQGVNVMETLEVNGVPTYWSVSDESGEIVEIAEKTYVVALFGKRLP